MFSQAWIIPSVHGVGMCMAKEACVAKGACMVEGDLCGKGEHAWWGGEGMHGMGGVCSRGACIVGHAWQGGMHGGGRACVAWGPCGRRHGHCSGRYTSYWNVFLFGYFFFFHFILPRFLVKDISLRSNEF